MLNIIVYTYSKNGIKIFINNRNNLDDSTCPNGQPAPLSPIRFLQGLYIFIHVLYVFVEL